MGACGMGWRGWGLGAGLGEIPAAERGYDGGWRGAAGLGVERDGGAGEAGTGLGARTARYPRQARV